MEIAQIKVAPEFQKLIPPLSTEERDLLEKNILKDGCRDALVVWQGLLLDGHNRLEICKAHDIPFKTVDAPEEIKDRTDARIWIRNNQAGRRNLTPAWKIELELGNKEDLLKKGREKQAQAIQERDELGRAVPVVSRNDRSGEPEKHSTRTTIAKSAGVSTGQVGMAEQVRKKAPELWEQAKAGEVSISTAYKQTKKVENKENRKKREIEETKKELSIPARVIQSDCLQIIDKIGPINLLIADPPYFTDGNFTGHISECLKRVSQSGQAYVFTSADPTELLAYLSMDSHHMLLEQMLVWNYNNTGQRQPNKRYTSNYQVCLYYRAPGTLDINKPADGKHQYACQTVNAPDGRIGDRYFKWQKPMELVERLIRNSSNKDDFVFDPFVGTGTTVLCAAKLGRKNLGCDIDADRIKECKQRGCEVEQSI